VGRRDVLDVLERERERERETVFSPGRESNCESPVVQLAV
jgi:hypothetical protein